MGACPDGRILLPLSILWTLVIREGKGIHWANGLYKVRSQCQEQGTSGPNGKGYLPGQQWQIEFSELPRKGGYRCMLVPFLVAGGFPCRTVQARAVIKVF